MSSFEDIADGEPPTIDPYKVLNLERTATAKEVTSAYRKAALKHHPDKVADDKKKEAHEAFQQIAFAYAILSNPDRRKRYDDTGSTSESVVDSDGFSWSDFYREQFRDAISQGAIEKFAKEYKGSEEEKEDILTAFFVSKGNMDVVYEQVMLSNVLEDDERFRAIIDQAIAEDEVENYKKYKNESQKSKDRRVQRAKGEAAEAEEYAKELGVHDKLFGGKGKKSKKDSEADLAAIILKRQESRGSFLDNLAEKYGAAPKGKGKKRVAEEEEPDEEAFQAAAARLKKPKAKADGAKKGKR